MRLVLLRHADAEDKDARADFDRRLTQKGRAQATAIGQALAKAGVLPEAVLSSPATRALETAVLAAAPLGWPIDRIVTEKRLYPGGPAEVVQAARQHAAGKLCIVVVGHNPGLREAVQAICGAEAEWSLPKASAAIVETDAELQGGRFVERLDA